MIIVKNKLGEPLNIDKKVLVLAERLKTLDATGALSKSTTQNKQFCNKILMEKLL